jgi:hypothetical protein
MPTTTQQTLCVFVVSAGRGWQGAYPSTLDGIEDLEDVFRYFNVVTADDVARLGLAGYDLPSLSANDLVGIIRHDGRVDWYMCVGHGWSGITDAQAQAYMILAQRAHRAGKRPPMFTDVSLGKDQTIMTVTDDGTVHINRTGYSRIAN